MHINQLTFFLTDRCPAACKICCFQCSPKNTFVMDEDIIKRYIDEGAALGTLKIISYTGGECMMYPDLFKRVAKYAYEKYGLISNTVTNGFWAKDYEKGKKLMQEMKECGVNSLRLSADDFHQEYVSVQTIKNAIRILYELGMATSITVMDTKARQNIRHVVEQLRPEIYLMPMVSYYPLHLPQAVIDNPEVTLTHDDLETPTPWEYAYCVDAGSIEFYTDGYMYNCCSQFTFEMPRMRLGKIGETSLEDAIKKLNRDPVLDLLRRESVTWFARKAKELGYPVKERYSMGCELCRDILCNKELMKKLVPLVEEEVQRQRVAKLFSPEQN